MFHEQHLFAIKCVNIYIYINFIKRKGLVSYLSGSNYEKKLCSLSSFNSVESCYGVAENSHCSALKLSDILECFCYCYSGGIGGRGGWTIDRGKGILAHVGGK